MRIPVVRANRFMLRVWLTSVLMSLIALPHGICFCHYLEASPPPNEPVCCDLQEPAPTPPQDLPDDDETNCPCCNRQIPTSSPDPVSAQRDGSANLDTILAMNGFAQIPAPVLDFERSTHFRLFDGPVALILCALRI